MKFISLIFIITLIVSPVISSIDQLSTLSSDIVTATSLTSGSKDFTVTFNTALGSTPTIAYALFSFFSANFQRYAIQISTSGLSQSGVTFTIALNQNIWTSLSYIIISSVSDNIVLGNLTLNNLGLSSSKTPNIQSQTVSSIITKVQDQVKFDVFIVGFDLQVASSASQFYLNTVINYGDADKTNSLYSTYDDYVYKISTSGNSFTLPTGISVTSTTLSLALSWIGTLASLQLTYISHPVSSPLATSQLTTGFNTVSINSKSNLSNITLINPKNNKNNLGSFSIVSLYGFTGIGLTPVTTLDATITLQYSYFVNLTTTGSTIDFLNTSYYFYQIYASTIVDYLFDQQIPITWDSNLGTPTTRTSTLNPYYTVNLAAGGFTSISSSFNLLNGNKYQFIIEALDQQGCWNDASSVKFSFQITFANEAPLSINNTSSFIVNPNVICVSQSATQFATPVQNMFQFYTLQVTASSNMITYLNLTSQSTAGKIYFKNMKLFLMSPNQFIDPKISESSVNAFTTMFTTDPYTSFYYSLTPNTVSDAILGYANKDSIVGIFSPTLTLDIATTYIFSFYMLDSAGNITNSFSSPSFILTEADNDGIKSLETVAATIIKPFCSPNFNATQPLTTPIDSFYLMTTMNYKPSAASLSVGIMLSDNDISNHMYAFKQFTLKKIQYYDPVARTNGASCPANTYLTTNVQPYACQRCDAQGKIDTGSGCVCPSGTVLDSSTFICKCPTDYSMSSTGICIHNPVNPININPYQTSNSFTILIYLSTFNKSPLSSNCIFNCTSISFKDDNSKLTTGSTNILNVNFFPHNLVELIIQNPSTDLSNTIVIVNINNTNINQTYFQFKINHLYSSNTMIYILSSSDGVASQVLLSILLVFMMLFYIFGDNLYNNINFIQKLSFLRFNLGIVPTTFSFLYGLRYSYYAYGKNALQNNLSQYYLENSNGNYYLVDKDANILRNVGIPIIFSVAIIIFKLLAIVIFKTEVNDEKKARGITFKKCYNRTIEYLERTIMFPIIFFSIAQLTFANLNFTSDRAVSSIFITSFAFSIIYIVYFATTVIITFYFNPNVSKQTKMQLIGEYLFDVIDSVIIIQTYSSQNILTLILTIVARCSYEMLLKYLYGTFIKLDLIKVIVMVLQIALIGILGNNVTTLSSIQALFVCIVVINMIYATGKMILAYITKKQNYNVEQTVGTSQIQVPGITDSAQIIHVSTKD